MTSPDVTSPDVTSPDVTSPDEFNYIKSEINLCEQEKLKYILINIIDKRRDLIKIIKKYLEA